MFCMASMDLHCKYLFVTTSVGDGQCKCVNLILDRRRKSQFRACRAPASYFLHISLLWTLQKKRKGKSTLVAEFNTWKSKLWLGWIQQSLFRLTRKRLAYIFSVLIHSTSNHMENGIKMTRHHVGDVIHCTYGTRRTRRARRTNIPLKLNRNNNHYVWKTDSWQQRERESDKNSNSNTLYSS